MKITQTFWSTILVVLMTGFTMAQAPEKAAPFTAVKWENELPIVRINNEWYPLLKINDLDAKNIVDFCKKAYDSKYQKRFSEDLVEVLTGMGKPPGSSVKLTLKKDAGTIVKTVEMTKENRQLAWKYNNEATEVVSNDKIEIVEQHTDKNYEVKAGDKTVIQPKSGLFTIKAAKITYEYKGIIEGTDVLYFDNYGETVVLVQTRPSELQGGNQTIIYKDKKTTIINHTRKTVANSPFRPKDTEPPTIATSANRESEGYEKLANETIAGKECEVYHNKAINAKYWLWNNIDLRLENYTLGKNGYTKNATSVETITSIPNDLFLIPEGYEK